MILFKAIIKKPLKNTKGFTLMELMIVVAIVASLSSFAIINQLSARAKAMDSAALSDARNIVESVVDSIMNNADVDFTKDKTGGPVGAVDTGGNPRTPVFILSPGVIAEITGRSNYNGGSTTYFSATIYHPGGTPGREFYCEVDEDAGTSLAPSF